MSIESNPIQPELEGIAIRTAEQLGAITLDRIFRGELAAIRVENFCDPALASRLSQWALSQARAEYYNDVIVDERITRIPFGVNLIADTWPYNSTFGTPQGSPERLRYREA